MDSAPPCGCMSSDATVACPSVCTSREQYVLLYNSQYGISYTNRILTVRTVHIFILRYDMYILQYGIFTIYKLYCIACWAASSTVTDGFS